MPIYFTLAELVKSNTARAKGIDNTPTFEVVEHLLKLTEKVLDPLRAAWKAPIRISSGYRSPALNNAVGGAATSVHMIGYAADMQTTGPFSVFRDFVVDWLESTGTKFDQLLIERDTRTGARWLHIGLYSNSGKQRGIIKVMEK